MYSNAHLYQEIDNDPKTFFCIYAISIIFHLIFICALIFAPKFTPDNKPLASVINVSLVSLPENKILSKSVRPKKIDSKTDTEVAVNTAKKSAKPVPLGKKKKRVKKSLKKRTYKPEKIRKKVLNEKAFKKKALKNKSLQQIEQKVEEAESDPLAMAFERLREEIKKSEAGKQNNKESGKDVRVENFNGIAGKKRLELINIYRVEVAYQVQKNWAFSEQLAGGRTDFMAEIAFKIMPDGEIQDIWFDKRSGNIYLDESARKAIIKSNPVRPHPAGIHKSYVIVGLRFTPEGIR
ncbi:MAG: TonB C-terminal domain-containing protein [Deltaproteobacteria bacterium]|nr:TonB C-terminal domain-containing protein [Deltaproteobacteria bacterium]